ncbi:uncharacterized protein LOC127796378 isoform X2 [Diospyros lotus]|uniref:uncharacterized protein LOC127796378 isoform X2 n=1 Tax=Diospyros lotus TaxID=55363 RepID=UPI0022554B24|nr:uncharacterized protein LOC127796378 isoform X2 [Diospyros lotus]XP_052184437.1 uncharacterized protein LOC127796378 isoform X2 [Diospyros lotus]XP_052184438.1 uncharacterized protein LOC127796378 isoform X2 [Diospyros lotus]XP_052184439.1 uncharacterized protein LOC127796378 isoform X2 [Diospyros lotus]
MAYVPPHMRHAKDAEKPPPKPELLVPQFRRSLNFGSTSRSNLERGKGHNQPSSQAEEIEYAYYSKHRWFVTGSPGDDQFPSYAGLETISLKSFEQRSAEPPLMLVLDAHVAQDVKESDGDVRKRPWEYVAENVREFLLSSFQKQELEGKPTLLARFGKILFPGKSLTNVEAGERKSVSETTLKQMKRYLYTNLPVAFIQHVTSEAVPKLGLEFAEEKELYYVELSDSMRPDSVLLFKCKVMEDCKKLQVHKEHKIELTQVRHLTSDVSCLDKKLDLRLILYTKEVFTVFTDDEKHCIRNLVNSAVLNSEVKGGLRWPLGQETSGGRFTVVKTWHTNAKIFQGSSMRLKVRDADRFDFLTSVGEVAREVSLKMTEISEPLKQNDQVDLVTRMLEDNLRLIWECFLDCDCSFE